MAMLLAGSMYLIGFGDIEKNFLQAHVYFKRAANMHNNSLAQYLIGMIYLEEANSYEVGIKWLKMSANNGCVSAQARLGLLYQMGDAELRQDNGQAIRWYQKAIEEHRAPRKTKFLFGRKNFELKFKNTSLSKALKATCNERLVSPSYITQASAYYPSRQQQQEGRDNSSLAGTEAAAQDNAVAQALLFYTTSNNYWEIPICYFNLGNLHNYISHDHYPGDSDRNNQDDKTDYYMMGAAHSKHRVAQCFAIFRVKERVGSYKEFFNNCLKWYDHSQKKAIPLVKISSEFAYVIKTSHEENKSTVMKLYWQNTVLSRNLSQGALECLLGNVYEYNENYEMAINQYKKAAGTEGEVSGLGATLLGRLYEQGKGGNIDYKKAFKWYSEGASRNCPISQFSLAWMYFNGCYVNTDLDHALALYEIALENGFNKTSAQEGIELVNIVKSTSPDQDDFPQEVYDRLMQIIKPGKIRLLL